MFTSKGILGFWSKDLNHDKIFEEPVSHTPVMGKSSTEGPREEPATINLVRAVFDEAQNVINKIDRELAMLEKRKVQLGRDRVAHVELLEVAKKHVMSSEAK